VYEQLREAKWQEDKRKRMEKWRNGKKEERKEDGEIQNRKQGVDHE